VADSAYLARKADRFSSPPPSTIALDTEFANTVLKRSEGLSDGGMAMEAYAEAIGPSTSAERKTEIERELKAYCALDTEAMIRIWEAFSGR
jgi:hypothetical protein